MRQNPYIDRVLPPTATEATIRRFWTVVYPAMPKEQQEYANAVLLSLPNCPGDILEVLRG